MSSQSKIPVDSCQSINIESRIFQIQLTGCQGNDVRIRWQDTGVRKVEISESNGRLEIKESDLVTIYGMLGLIELTRDKELIIEIPQAFTGDIKVSGILAVVASGIMHSFDREKINPETAGLNISSDSVWGALVFVLNGLVFLILGTQLPTTIEAIWSISSVGKLKIIAYIIIVTLALMLIRFLWSLLTIKKDTYEPEDRLSKIKASILVIVISIDKNDYND